VDETAIAKLFEELKVYFRELPEQVESKLAKANGGPSRRWRRKSRFHPGMMEEFLFLPRMLDGGPDGSNGEAVTWLMLASMLRDDAPWFYKMGIEVFKALRSGKPVEPTRRRAAVGAGSGRRSTSTSRAALEPLTSDSDVVAEAATAR
jgi:hypothetical protein